MFYAAEQTHSFSLTGIPALLLILAFVAVFAIGVFTVLRAVGRKAKEKL